MVQAVLPLDLHGVALGGSHLDTRGSVESVVDLVKGLRTFDVLQATSKILMSMEAVSSGGIKGVQRDLAKELYPAEASKKLILE